MQLTETKLPGVVLVEPKVYGDERGWFAEVYNRERFAGSGLPSEFVQDNQSFSRRGVLRGLHYQLVKPQGKLVRVLEGHIWDVAVDLRRGSEHFGEWVGVDLKGDSLKSLWIPEGFGHGFVVLSETATVLYKATNLYFPEGERCIRWDDPALGIAWPIEGMTPSVSAKDAAGVALGDAEVF